MTVLPPETRERIAKLLPLLASDKDGEALGAVRAIERTLQAAGSDFHDLTEVIVGKRSGWVPPGTRRPPPTRPTSGRFSYADAYKESAPLFDGPEHPEALTRRFGLHLYTLDRVEPWPEVARHCLHLDRSVPKKHGGKILNHWQKGMIKSFSTDGRFPTNRQVEFLERTVARLHQARDAAARPSS